jgi:hypothetical protein
MEFAAMANRPASVAANGSLLAPLATEQAFETATSGWIYRAQERKLVVKLPNARVSTIRVQ